MVLHWIRWKRWKSTTRKTIRVENLWGRCCTNNIEPYVRIRIREWQSVTTLVASLFLVQFYFTESTGPRNHATTLEGTTYDILDCSTLVVVEVVPDY